MCHLEYCKEDKFTQGGLIYSAFLVSKFELQVDFPAGVVTMGTESGKKLNAYDDEGDMTLKFAKKVHAIYNIGFKQNLDPNKYLTSNLK